MAESFLRSLDDLRRGCVVLLVFDQVAGLFIEVDPGQRIAGTLGLVRITEVASVSDLPWAALVPTLVTSLL